MFGLCHRCFSSQKLATKEAVLCQERVRSMKSLSFPALFISNLMFSFHASFFIHKLIHEYPLECYAICMAYWALFHLNLKINFKNLSAAEAMCLVPSLASLYAPLECRIAVAL